MSLFRFLSLKFLVSWIQEMSSRPKVQQTEYECGDEKCYLGEFGQLLILAQIVICGHVTTNPRYDDWILMTDCDEAVTED